MAAVTINRRRDVVFGNRRAILADVTVVTTGDTWVTKLKRVETIAVSNPAGITNTSQSAGTVTFTGTGTNVLVLVLGI